MSAALEEITERALKFPPQERLALANRLLSQDDEANAPAIEVAWEEEILARIKTIDEGTAVGIPFDEVVGAARKRRAR